MSFLAALRFLTVIPVPIARAASPNDLGRSLSYFPLVGALLGVVLAGLDRGMTLVIPSTVVSGLLIAALALMTGGIHLDGFIDTCDGLMSGRSAEQRWEVMRDSRVGAFGVIGAICLLLLKYVCFAELPKISRLGALVLMPAVARWAVVCAIFAVPYATSGGLGRAFKEQATWKGVLVATATALTLSLALLGLKGAALMAGAGLVTLALVGFLRRMFAGLTGDSYGAIVEVCEVTALLLAIALGNSGW